MEEENVKEIYKKIRRQQNKLTNQKCCDFKKIGVLSFKNILMLLGSNRFKTCLDVRMTSFFCTRLGDWVFCVMRKYHSHQSMEFNMVKKVNINTIYMHIQYA